MRYEQTILTAGNSTSLGEVEKNRTSKLLNAVVVATVWGGSTQVLLEASLDGINWFPVTIGNQTTQVVFTANGGVQVSSGLLYRAVTSSFSGSSNLLFQLFTG